LSGGSKSIIGYSKIINVLFKTSSEVKQYYINRIQMGKEDFDNYIKNRESKALLLLELENIVEFKKMISVDFPMTMAGKYMQLDKIKQYSNEQFQKDLLKNELFSG
jgi:hypothetical protein